MAENPRFPPWIQYDIGQWGALIDPRYLMRFQRKSLIYNQQDKVSAIYILKSGRVRLSYSSNEGEEKIFFLGLPGCMFGEEASFLAEAQVLYAIALVQCEIYCIPKDEFLFLLSQDISLNAKVLSSMSHKVHITMEHIRRLCFLDARQRVAAVFVDLACVFSRPGQTTIQIDIPITQQGLANMVNVSRVTVNQIISEFKVMGLIDKIDGHWMIYDTQTLKRLSGSI